ncbi:MAG: hypothetical protein KTQ49_03710 [Candidatus Omnitrophica bacterium]|nr:hypothetical protein [Candidatus Omnitrophota bacterium]
MRQIGIFLLTLGILALGAPRAGATSIKDMLDPMIPVESPEEIDGDLSAGSEEGDALSGTDGKSNRGQTRDVKKTSASSKGKAGEAVIDKSKIKNKNKDRIKDGSKKESKKKSKSRIKDTEKRKTKKKDSPSSRNRS